MKNSVKVALAVAAASMLGVGVGAAIRPATPASCLQALDAGEQQYSTLQGVLPVAAEAVDAALYRSVARLDASTSKINTIKLQLDKQQSHLDKTKEQCRG